MSFLSDHSSLISLIVSLAVMIFGLVVTWTKMRDKIDVLVERANDNKAAIQKSYIDLKEAFVNDLAMFRSDHDRTREILSIHVMNVDIHQSSDEKIFRAEWRSSVMDRLERIEAGIEKVNVRISDLKRCGEGHP